MAQELGVILLYAVGMALVLLEIILPGVVLGLVGLACVLASIYFAFTMSAVFGWTLTGLTVASVPVLIMLWVRIINKYFAMKHTEEGYTGAQVRHKDLLGKEGVALTMLRPAGTALINGAKVDVVSDGEVIDRDARVKVIEVTSNRVVVHAVRS